MKTIILTRLLVDNQADRHQFQAQGFTTIEIPLMSLKKRSLPLDSLKKLTQSEWVFLTSPHAAEFFVELSKTVNIHEKKYAVIGKKTGQVLLDKGLSVAYQAPVSTKQQLFEGWKKSYSEPKTIFYPKSNLADSLGEAALIKAGYQLSTSILYDNYFSEQSRKVLKHVLLTRNIDAVYVTSPSLWQRFLLIFKETNQQKMPTLYWIGPTTEQAIKKDGY